MDEELADLFVKGLIGKIEELSERNKGLEAALLEVKDEALRYDCLVDALNKRNSELEAAINDWHYTIVDWEGCDFIERISNPTHRKVIEDVVNAHATFGGEKKDAE